MLRTADAVAGLNLLIRTLLEEFLLLARLILVLLSLPVLRWLRGLLLGLRLRRRCLHLRLLARLRTLLARSILTTPAPAAMSLSWRLHRLTIVRH